MNVKIYHPIYILEINITVLYSCSRFDPYNMISFNFLSYVKHYIMMTTQPFFLGMQQVFHDNQVIHESEIHYTPHPSLKQTEGIYIYGENELLNNTIAHKIIQSSFKNEGLSWIIIHTSGQLFKYFYPNVADFFVPTTMEIDAQHTKYHVPLNFLTASDISAMLGLSDGMEREVDHLLTTILATNVRKPTAESFEIALINAIKNDPTNKDLQLIQTHWNNASFSKKPYSEIGTRMIHIAKKTEPSLLHIYLPTKETRSIFIAPIIAEIKRTIYTINQHNAVTQFGIVFDDISACTHTKSSISAIHDLFWAWGRTYQLTRMIIYRAGTTINPLFDDPILPLRSDGKYQMIFYSHANGLCDFLNRTREGADFLPLYIDHLKIIDSIETSRSV